jgi:hypothetical protein
MKELSAPIQKDCITFQNKNKLKILLDSTIKHVGSSREGVWDTKNISSIQSAKDSRLKNLLEAANVAANDFLIFKGLSYKLEYRQKYIMFE